MFRKEVVLKMKTIYKPYEQRSPDSQYENLLLSIVRTGKDKIPIHARLDENKGTGHQNSRELTGEKLSYDLSNGFPLLTCRDLTKSFFGSIGEVVAFLNGATTLKEMIEYGCPRIFWERWVTEEKSKLLGLEPGSLGRGSYGKSLTNFQTEEGVPFDQVTALLNNMKKRPFLRTHVLTSWNPPYSMGDVEKNRPREVAVAPCHGNFIHFVLFDHLREVEMSVVCRSSDVPVGLPLNISEWAGLGMMVSYLMNYKFTKYTVFLTNPHYYDIQKPSVYEILMREPRAFPTVELKPDREVTRIQDFRKDDFVLSDYHPNPKMMIPTPV